MQPAIHRVGDLRFYAAITQVAILHQCDALLSGRFLQIKGIDTAETALVCVFLKNQFKENTVSITVQAPLRLDQHLQAARRSGKIPFCRICQEGVFSARVERLRSWCAVIKWIPLASSADFRLYDHSFGAADLGLHAFVKMRQKKQVWVFAFGSLAESGFVAQDGKNQGCKKKHRHILLLGNSRHFKIGPGLHFLIKH